MEVSYRAYIVDHECDLDNYEPVIVAPGYGWLRFNDDDTLTYYSKFEYGVHLPLSRVWLHHPAALSCLPYAYIRAAESLKKAHDSPIEIG